ncbi:MAG: gliding motility-associated C-terminal domain-containing protein, partial [Saprospiraceae bacterium]|nr:gliding motility-associated C-terminal domain-containing protein [Saprospiraceae bacterium]
FMVTGLMPGEEVVMEVLAHSNNSCGDQRVTVRCTTETCPELTFDLDDNLSFCENEVTSNFEIPFELPGSSPDGTFEWSGPGVTDPVNGIIDLQSLGTGVYQYVVVYTEDICIYSDTVLIDINPVPQADAGPDATLTCKDSVYIYSGLGMTGPIYTWQPTVPTSGRFSIFSEEGVYTLFVRDPTTGCMDMDTLVVTREDNVPADMELEVISGACDSTELGSMRIDSILGGVEPFQFSFDNGPFTSQRNFTDLQAGDHTVRVMDANGCELVREFTIGEGDPIEVELGPDREIYAGTTIRVDAQTNKMPSSITWTPNDKLSCTDCLFPSLSPDSTLTLTIRVIDENGCTATDQIRISVKYRRFFVPNTFSPNGDGLNDIFRIYGNEEVKTIKTFQVYDRWGEKVFSLENIDFSNQIIGWDGTFNGEILDPGVYVVHAVIVFRDGQEEVVTSDVTLIR